jgi:hypothetical protein
LFSKSDQQQFINYDSQIDENFSYQFRYRVINYKQKVPLLGISVFCMVIKEENLVKDIQLLLENLRQACEYSQMNILLIIHSNQT